METALPQAARLRRFSGWFLIAFGAVLALAFAPASIATALTEEETKRAEAAIPLLDGRQEYWAIGEFVHMGAPAVPVLVKGLTHPSRRVRTNVIEALYLIKDKSAAPALTGLAANPDEIPAVREKALRVAIQLDPSNAVPALQALAKDRSETIRNAVAHESRRVKDKAVIGILIDMLADDSPTVADEALRTLSGFTGRLVERQDFAQSTKEQRVAWSREWAEWWQQKRNEFRFTAD